MNKQLNANIVAAVLVGFFALALVGLPIRFEIHTNATDAQATTGSAVDFTLTTFIGGNPAMAFVGVGGAIDKQVNPTLNVRTGDKVSITLVNGDPVAHDLSVDAFSASTGQLTTQGQKATISFTPTAPGDYTYYCNVPGHQMAGMQGTIHVTGDAIASTNATAAPMGDMAGMSAAPTAGPADPNAVSIVHNPTDLPAPIGSRGPTTVRVDLTTQEVVGKLADGTTYSYFTFNGTVPGPMIRVRVGDTVDLHLKNAANSTMIHSIDLHAVTGPGGGAIYTQTKPGEETTITFQALKPGVYVYHCATPSVAHHIQSGMYGLIVVEPEGGLPPVSKEFYVMQGEIYTAQPFGTKGQLTFDEKAMRKEEPEYFVFNGAANALTADDTALRAKVGDTVRIFFGVGGPNFTSSFHVIGEIFDRVYDFGSLSNAPLKDVQTTLVPPGGATMVEFTLEVPGRYILVDHALARMEQGLMGFLYADGPDNPTVYHGGQLTPGSGH